MKDIKIVGAAFSVLLFAAAFGANAQQNSTAPATKTAPKVTPKTAPKAPAPNPQTDSRDKMRTQKDLKGKDYQSPWWQELTSCGGQLYALSIHANRPKENMDAFRQNSNVIGNYGVQRLMLDRGIDLNAARAIASENFTNASRAKEMSYTLNMLLAPELRQIDREKTTDATLKNCSETFGEYARTFPELFQAKPAN